MAQVAFDTQEFVDTLEKEGLPRNQAKAISLVIRKSHEVADLATKRNLDDIRKDIDARFDKTDAQIAEVRKDLSAEIADVRKDMEHGFEKVETQIADVRKDITQIEKRFDRLEIKFDRLQWLILAGILGLLFKDVLPKLWGG
ncbi:hypothetical protein QE193_25585 (plasmid) [Arsenophonus nasoniae]|uniref:DUF1640 domain-containing protein n=1 Tax=Arsenophonus nasoniae TaxID=638 RepID=A0A4P7L3K7_9GAMM|nr:hypothetical protein [Arsenophonus nasoniae]QBY46996.1 hypothetical protein ArsFIN_56070 [Arsenophonus nasoniae]WGM18525.1 hypothetical protein QE193_25585 [Arsenophonus nasoniae]